MNNLIPHPKEAPLLGPSFPKRMAVDVYISLRVTYIPNDVKQKDNGSSSQARSLDARRLL